MRYGRKRAGRARQERVEVDRSRIVVPVHEEATSKQLVECILSARLRIGGRPVVAERLERCGHVLLTAVHHDRGAICRRRLRKGRKHWVARDRLVLVVKRERILHVNVLQLVRRIQHARIERDERVEVNVMM